MDKLTKGNLGETAVCNYLKERHYELVCRNYRKRCGEIDIIARDGKYIVFVEVKTRRLNSMVSGIEAVTKAKQKKIILTADLYLTENPCDLQPRYDIAEVTVSYGENPRIIKIEYYEGAFDTTGIYCVN